MVKRVPGELTPSEVSCWIRSGVMEIVYDFEMTEIVTPSVVVLLASIVCDKIELAKVSGITMISLKDATDACLAMDPKYVEVVFRCISILGIPGHAAQKNVGARPAVR